MQARKQALFLLAMLAKKTCVLLAGKSLAVAFLFKVWK